MDGWFSVAIVVLGGFLVAQIILNFSSMWGIVRVWAASVLWFIVGAWSVVFHTGTEATGTPDTAPPSRSCTIFVDVLP